MLREFDPFELFCRILQLFKSSPLFHHPSGIVVTYLNFNNLSL